MPSRQILQYSQLQETWYHDEDRKEKTGGVGLHLKAVK